MHFDYSTTRMHLYFTILQNILFDAALYTLASDCDIFIKGPIKR